MIDFACKNISFKELLMCSYALNKTEYNVLMKLMNLKEFISINELSKKMKKERSTIQKAMKKLFEKKLVMRRQMNLTTGGFIYEYKLKNKEELKKEIINLIKSWSASAIKKLEEE